MEPLWGGVGSFGRLVHVVGLGRHQSSQVAIDMSGVFGLASSMLWLAREVCEARIEPSPERSSRGMRLGMS